MGLRRPVETMAFNATSEPSTLSQTNRIDNFPLFKQAGIYLLTQFNSVSLHRHIRQTYQFDLFDGGFGYSFTARQGVRIDETACYESLQKTHDVRDALVVGYAAEPWCQSNNNFLARITRDLPWAHPTAYIDLTDPLTADHLKRLQADGFVGISIYCFDEKTMTAIEKTNTDTWQWLVEHRWLISVNSRGHYWSVWESVLQQHKQLRVLVSHLGLPQKVS